MGNVYLVFIGVKTRSKEWMVERKPSFSDFIFLSHQSSSIVKDSPYQYIPLRDIEKKLIILCDENIQVIFNEFSVQIQVENEVPEERIYEALGHFLLVQGKRVFNLSKFPVHKASRQKVIKLRILSTSKRIRETDERNLYDTIRCKIQRS